MSNVALILVKITMSDKVSQLEVLSSQFEDCTVTLQGISVAKGYFCTSHSIFYLQLFSTSQLTNCTFVNFTDIVIAALADSTIYINSSSFSNVGVAIYSYGGTIEAHTTQFNCVTKSPNACVSVNSANISPFATLISSSINLTWLKHTLKTVRGRGLPTA